MEQITVVKIGGNVIDNPEALKRFLEEFAALPGAKILIRGGGQLATRLAERLDLKEKKVDGRRDPERLRRVLDGGSTPVFSAIMHDGQGTLLNCNADSVASAIALGAAEIAPADLVFCFEKSGVLRDPEDDTTLIREITAETYAPLKADGIVSKGMIPKIENALKAVEKGVRSVTIKHSDYLLNDTGTVIK